MKTKKDLHEEIIKKQMWKKKRDKAILICVGIAFTIVIVWKFPIMFLNPYSFVKIGLIALGGGYLSGFLFSLVFIRIDIQKEKRSINKEIKRCLKEIEKICGDDEIAKDPNLKYPVFEEQRQKVLNLRAKKLYRIRRLREKIARLEIEYLMLEYQG